ncbi:hypothetical protein N9383_02155 [Granulosicoccus sp.]|nr:hypothetical protein [Granulosicoccus sp.]
MLKSASVAVFAGIWKLTIIDGTNAAAALGAVLIIYVGFGLANTGFHLCETKTRRFEPAMGAMTECINRLTGAQVV